MNQKGDIMSKVTWKAGTFIYPIPAVMVSCGDNSAALIVVKSITYVFLYVYCQNAFKNLIIAYPKNIALRIIYHCIRLEFTRMLPSYWKPIIERVENDINKS